MNVSFTSLDFKLFKTLVLEAHKAQDRFNHMNTQQKCTVWCSPHADWVVGPYIFDNDTAVKVEYYPILDTNVPSEA